VPVGIADATTQLSLSKVRKSRPTRLRLPERLIIFVSILSHLSLQVFSALIGLSRTFRVYFELVTWLLAQIVYLPLCWVFLHHKRRVRKKELLQVHTGLLGRCHFTSKIQHSGTVFAHDMYIDVCGALAGHGTEQMGSCDPSRYVHTCRWHSEGLAGVPRS
jgi:hypothetical protein